MNGTTGRASDMDWVLTIHLAATVWMAAIYAFVQWVHYPMFARLREEGYADAHAFHCRRISYLVGPGFLLEAGCAAALVFATDAPQWHWAIVGGILCVANLALTFFFAVPLHDRLSRRCDPVVLAKLLRVNGWRTVAAGLRVAVALVLVLSAK
jgi:hypothetical protein